VVRKINLTLNKTTTQHTYQTTSAVDKLYTTPATTDYKFTPLKVLSRPVVEFTRLAKRGLKHQQL
jgi:hypothetical protein